ncbi:MAG: hypothetical protein ACMUIE_02835 [Thermoplasmatota archaeon]
MTGKDKILDSPAAKGPDPRYIFPIRSEVDWTYRESLIVLEYPKNFNRMERALNKVLKGPENIKRPLDNVGTLLWELSDGDHSLLEIYIREQERFHERVEPVDKVVGGLLETMLKLGLMRLEYHPEGQKRSGERRRGKKVVVRALEK